jgi:hypothetical protein
MYYIIYLSAGVKWFSETELKDILAVSNVNNRRDDITGLLLYSEGNFIQLLEGEENVVQQTFQKISGDERHKGITHIASGLLAERNFPEWAMGFKSIDAESAATFEGYVNPANKNMTRSEGSHISTNLLKAFIRTARMGVDPVAMF